MLPHLSLLPLVSLFRLLGLTAVLGALSACVTMPPLDIQSPPSAEAPQPESKDSSLFSFFKGASGSAAKPNADAAREILSSLPSANTLETPPVARLDAPETIWDRIRVGFDMPDLDTDLVRDREQWYAAKPDYLFRMTERSRKYMFHIVEELERRNMPTELALLPFIESAFNPQAVSTAKAAGMWQFIPSTGKYFDLKQNTFRDDRRDVLASTRAALDYLQKLHGMFGDWHLALAAYNWGQGNVRKAIAKNQQMGLGTSYVDLNMPMETRMYVPKLMAMKWLVAAPEKYNLKLPDIGNHPYFETVTLSRDMDVALVAKLAEIPLQDFKALNPSLNKPVVLAAGNPQILLPWDNANLFLRNLDAFTGARLSSWTVWVAPSTMKVADAAHKVGMSEAEFRQLNQIPPKMLVRSGSALLVPRSLHMDRDVTEHLADHGQVNLAPEQAGRKKSSKQAKAVPQNKGTSQKNPKVNVAAVKALPKR